MDIITLALALASVVLNVVVLSKLAKISRQVEQPQIKKMTPELNLKPVSKNFEDRKQKSTGSKSNRSNRTTRSKKKSEESSDKKPSRSRNSSRNRLKPSSEILSNDNQATAGKESEVTPSEAPREESQAKSGRNERNHRSERAERSEKVEKTERSERPQRSERPEKSERPKLAPRGQKSEPAPASSSASTAPASAESPAASKPEQSAPKVEEAPKKIRHGRRAQVKKVPTFEDDA